MIDTLMWFIGAPVVTQWLRFLHIRSLSLSRSLSHIHIHAQPHCVSYHQQPSTAQRNTASINHTQTLLKCLVRLSSMDLFISVGTSLQTSQQLWTTHSVNRTRNTVSVSNVLSCLHLPVVWPHYQPKRRESPNSGSTDQRDDTPVPIQQPNGHSYERLGVLPFLSCFPPLDSLRPKATSEQHLDRSSRLPES